ncbi:MAG: glycosyltransferase [Calditrichaeota bacterium]|nr:glycosyltransferase [Calditrichota bacterium]
MSTLGLLIGGFQFLTGALIALALLRKSPSQKNELPNISIVVPARNEADNLPRLFASLSRLEYDPAKIELVLVNDDSTDKTAEVARELSRTLPFRFRLLDAEHGNGESLPPTKTLPLAQGIEAATGEFVLMTDGDCEVHPRWAVDMVRHFEPGVGLVCGITLPDYESSGERVTRLEAVDWSLLLGVCAGMCRLGKPVALIGNNYAVRSECYRSLGTFRSIAFNRIDDIALFSAVAESVHWKIAFAVTPGACIKTLPIGSTSDIVTQRYRWMEGVEAVKVSGKLLLGFGFFTHLLWPLALLLDHPFGMAVSLALLLGDWLVIAAVLTRLGKRGLKYHAFVYPAWSLAYGWRLLKAIFKRPEITWKERRLA